MGSCSRHVYFDVVFCCKKKWEIHMMCAEGPALFKMGQIVRWKKNLPFGYEDIFKGAPLGPFYVYEIENNPFKCRHCGSPPQNQKDDRYYYTRCLAHFRDPSINECELISSVDPQIVTLADLNRRVILWARPYQDTPSPLCPNSFYLELATPPP